MASRKSRSLPSQLRKLHPIEAFGNTVVGAGDIRVERLEERLSPKVPFPHKHDFYHFLLLLKGGGWHEIDFTRFPARSGCLFLMRPGQVHSWSLSSGARGIVLEFTAASLERTERNERLLEALQGLPLVLEEKVAASAPLLRWMLEEFEGRKAGYRAALEHLLAALLVRLSRFEAAAAGARASSLVERFRALLERHYQQEHSVEFYAAELGLGAKALSTRISRSTGRPAGALIQERCLLEAKRLLAYSELPVAEVGYRLGFEDPNYFARFFRQRAGMSPGKFRQLAARSVPH